MAKVFLAIVGVAYTALAIWCSVAPETTSAAVGFTLVPGAGQSEFLTVYGGLELALGILFLRPLLNSRQTSAALGTCLTVHACLVGFRTLGFLLYSDIPSGTYALAAVEWIIFLGSLTIVLLTRSATPSGES